jgi:hypothetical protein
MGSGSGTHDLDLADLELIASGRRELAHRRNPGRREQGRGLSCS